MYVCTCGDLRVLALAKSMYLFCAIGSQTHFLELIILQRMEAKGHSATPYTYPLTLTPLFPLVPSLP